MPIKCTLVQRIDKNGNPYKCIEIDLGQGCKKLVFLNSAEQALLSLQQNQSK